MPDREGFPIVLDPDMIEIPAWAKDLAEWVTIYGKYKMTYHPNRDGYIMLTRRRDDEKKQTADRSTGDVG